jgi:hypothetical protein
MGGGGHERCENDRHNEKWLAHMSAPVPPDKIVLP